MTQLKVIQAPAKVLNRKAKPVTYKEPKLRKLILDMLETLVKHSDPPGVGLAAPQIGKSKQIFIALLGTSGTEEDLNKGYYKAFINPQIISKSGDSTKSKKTRHTAEGCLSLKNYYGPVMRATKIKIKYQTLDFSELKAEKKPNWKKITHTETKTYNDFEARIMQHEIDHLSGQLFTSRIIAQQGSIYSLESSNGKEKWVEVELDL